MEYDLEYDTQALAYFLADMHAASRAREAVTDAYS